jgi:hypothetical protein
MNPEILFLIIILSCVLWLAIGLYWGYTYAIQHHKIESVESIRSYIKDNFATEWDAYQLGFKEGYEIGGKDGREPPL